MELVMAPRAYWKGYLKLSLVSCPVALFPASSEREKISFHQLNKNTGNRIKYRKVDAETGDEVESADIIKDTKSARANTLNSNRKNLKPSRLRASAPSKSMSSFLAKKLTNCTRTTRITSCRMAKLESKPLR
jgi:non-homologous end joining protein Ku